MNDSRTQEERDNEPESTVTYSGTHKKDTKSGDSIHSKEEANYKESVVDEIFDAVLDLDDNEAEEKVKQALEKAKEEGRREAIELLQDKNFQDVDTGVYKMDAAIGVLQELTDNCFVCGKEVPKPEDSPKDRKRWVDKCEECLCK